VGARIDLAHRIRTPPKGIASERNFETRDPLYSAQLEGRGDCLSGFRKDWKLGNAATISLVYGGEDAGFGGRVFELKLRSGL
jgi:hypothetical protein